MTHPILNMPISQYKHTEDKETIKELKKEVEETKEEAKDEKKVRVRVDDG